MGEGRAAHCARRLPGCGPRSLHSLSPPGPPLRSLVGLRRIPPKYLLTYFSIPSKNNVRTYKNIKEKLVLLVFWPLPLSPPERGRGRKLGGVENGSLRTGSGGFPGELKRRGKSPKPKGRRPKPAPCTPRKCFSLTRKGRCAGQSTQPGSCP